MSEIRSPSDFDHIELRNGGFFWLVAPTPRFDAQSHSNRGDRHKPGHDPGGQAAYFKPDRNLL